MGGSQSYPGLTEDLLEDYRTLTYLSKGEILHLMKKFYSINPVKIQSDYHHRFTKEEIVLKFEVLKSQEEQIARLIERTLPVTEDLFQNNPFQDRLFRIFSSKNDECFSFEDLLDLGSAMSPECPANVKAAWAFRIFDLDEDNQISDRDIVEILDRLTCDPSNTANRFSDDEKNKIAGVILDEMKLDSTGSIGLSEFKIILARLPEFEHSFYFKL